MNSLLYELPLVFVSGILGSAHCIGMCGAISATMSLGTSTVRGAMVRQLLWSLGRVFTYSFLGMVAGFAGARLSQSQFLSSQSRVVNLQAVFAVLAGILLIIQGLMSTGWLRRRVTGQSSCVTASLFGSFLRGGSNSGVLIAGLLTGFLPCGLVYSFLALAAATSSVWKGPILMTAFGLGTLPVMLLTGVGLNLASLRLRQRLMKAAAVCVLLTGILTVGRGLAFASHSENEKPEHACPLCKEAPSDYPAR
ncbi:MAG: sulfite exporter TauE/SafE family protein [Planctomycetaceae bacterium]